MPPLRRCAASPLLRGGTPPCGPAEPVPRVPEAEARAPGSNLLANSG